MNSRLFRVELERAALPLAIATGVSFGAVWVVGKILMTRGESASTTGTLVDQTVMGGMVLLAFAGGERAFGQQFTERTVGFLNTLPMARWSKWAHIILAHAGVVWGCTAILLALRPSLIAQDGSPFDIGSVLILQLLAFPAGCCCAVVLGRPLLIYSIGLPAVTIALVETAAIRPMVSIGLVVTDGSWLIGSAMPFAVLCLGLSLAMFVRGDFAVLSTRVANGFVFVAALLLFVMVGRTAVTELQVSEGWTIDTMWYARPIVVAADGGKMCVLERLTHNWAVGRLTLIDTQTSRRLGTFTGRNIRLFGWSANGSYLIVGVQDDRPSVIQQLLTPETRSILLLDPSGAIRSRIPIGTAGSTHVAQLEDEFLIMVEGATGTVVQIDADGSYRSIVPPVEVTGGSSMVSLREGVLADFSSGDKQSQAWLIANDSDRAIDVTSELSRPGVRTPCASPFGRLVPEFPSDGHAAALIGEGPKSGTYLFSPCTAVKMPVYHIDSQSGRGELRVRHPNGNWETIARNLWDTTRSQVGLAVAHNHVSGIVGFLEVDGATSRAVLYDPWLNRRLVLVEFEGSWEHYVFIAIKRLAGSDLVYVSVERDRDANLGGYSAGDLLFPYDPATGETRELTFSQSVVWVVHYNPMWGMVQTYWSTGANKERADESHFFLNGPSEQAVVERITPEGDAIRLWPLTD